MPGLRAFWFYISIHSLRMEGDFALPALLNVPKISIHSLRMEGDLRVSEITDITDVFQSTPSAWRETMRTAQYLSGTRRISIHSLRMEGDYPWKITESPGCISIHSLRMEGDLFYAAEFFRCRIISIHSLRMEGDDMRVLVFPPDCTFQSTPSAWRETSRVSSYAVLAKDFNPLPPHGGRRHKK